MANGKQGAVVDAGANRKHKVPVIVAIGASAGGVQALQSFFGALRENTGAAFIVVVHLDPKHRSELSTIVAGRTKMRVQQVENTVALEPNHVYVIPPDRRLQLVDHELSAKGLACEIVLQTPKL
jgi:two-component system, chemotaxis family, CheB/CheR fusion protein